MASRVLPAARADLQDIARYIGARNPSAARRWVARMEERCAKLGKIPGMGAPRPDLGPGLRSCPVGNYVILYREVGRRVEIVRVVHGARQWERLLR